MTTMVDETQRTADDIATGWLEDFEAALRAQDIDAAVDLFATTSYWRDLVSFTWNLRTVEDRATGSATCSPTPSNGSRPPTSS